jgi:phage-related protein
VAQFGGKHPAAKTCRGEGRGALEIVEDHAGNTFRAVYTIRFAEAVYVLHAFGRNHREVKTARRDVELVSERLKQARREHQERYAQQ